MTRGKFITVEGGEGVGKSTNMAYIEQQLKNAGKTVVVTREPGGTVLGEKLREVLLDASHTGICDDAELLLMFAARAQHLHEVICPALDRGEWVLCDRFTDATYAYQGGGRGIDTRRIEMLEQWVQGEIRPDYTILLDMPVEKGLERASQRSEPDRFEQEKQAFFEKVHAAYLLLAHQHKHRFRVIDASPALNVVQQQLDAVLNEILQSS